MRQTLWNESSWPWFYSQYATKAKGVKTAETELVISIEEKRYQWTYLCSFLILLSFAIWPMIP